MWHETALLSLWTDKSISPRVIIRMNRWISKIPLTAIAIGSINPSIWEAGRSISRTAVPREKTMKESPKGQQCRQVKKDNDAHGRGSS